MEKFVVGMQTGRNGQVDEDRQAGLEPRSESHRKRIVSASPQLRVTTSQPPLQISGPETS